jgi:hypothetical protein
MVVSNANNPNTGRFKCIPVGVAASPNHCACCGSSTRDVIDFGFTAEYYGAVLLCTECVTEAGKTLGMETKKEFSAVFDELNDEISKTGLRLELIENYISRTKADYDKLLRDIDNCSYPVNNVTNISPYIGVEVVPLPESTTANPDRATAKSDTTAKQGTKSAVNKRSNSISGSSGYGNASDIFGPDR